MTLSAFMTERDLGKFRKLVGSFKATIQQNIKVNHKWVTGTLYNTLVVDVHIEYNTLYVSLKTTNPAAFGTLEYGRKQGKTPRNFKDILKKWAVDKGITLTDRRTAVWAKKKYPFDQNKALDRFASAVAWKIKLQGTEQFRQGQNKNVYTNLNETFTNKCEAYVQKFLTNLFKAEIKSIDKVFEK